MADKADKKKQGATLEDTLKAEIDAYTSHSSGRIQAQVSSFKEGLQVYTKISIVRVRSRNANLLIMEDYMPILGEIDGAVDFIGKEEVHTLENVRGFFCHDHNVFFLLLKDARDSGRDKKGDKTVSPQSPDIISGLPIASAAAVEAQAERELINA
ncbi:MAG: hypothetical protein LBP28_03015 [Coriobacteriales bacterium]|nr:hypothetical protein [Coriobacteriales bacterium]